MGWFEHALATKSSDLTVLSEVSNTTSSSESILVFNVSELQKAIPVKDTWIVSFLYFFSVMFAVFTNIK